MTRNPERIVIWNYSKDKVIDIPLPNGSEVVSMNFDFLSNIFEPTMIISYRDIFQADSSGTLELRVNLINGQRI